MKLSKLALVAAIACGIHAGNAIGQDHNYSGGAVVAPQTGVASVGCDCGQPVCGCEAVGACGGGLCDSGCDSGCDACCDGGGCLLGDCCLGEPWTLFGDCGPWSAGGWIQMGYHNRALSMFNQHPDNFNLHQAWLWAEKSIDTRCGFDLGGRVDYLYGVDAQDTQAFGTDPRGWDNDWDHGIYGHALPQAYLEAGYGDLSVKAGHFFTLIGYEGVAAPSNFFYSHAYTHYFSEPFTHTGVLATYKASDDWTSYGGYVMGWDSGFDDNGDAYLGGSSFALTEDVTVTYQSINGRFNERRFGDARAERGHMNSLVIDTKLTDKLQYIFWTDYLDTWDANDTIVRNTFDITQMLIYRINDCWALGGRFEWYNVREDSVGLYGPNAIAGLENVAAGNVDIYQLTGGINYRPHANLIIRPEIRYDWINDDPALLAAADRPLLEGNGDDQTTFGIDAIFTF